MTSRNLSLNRPLTTERYEVSNGIIVAQSSTSSFSNSLTETFSQSSSVGDHVNPTEYSFSKRTSTNDIGSMHRRFYSGATSYEDILDRGPMSVSVADCSPEQWMVDTAFNNALSSMNDQLRGSLDLSIDIAQSGQVASMMRETLKLVRSVRGMPKDLIKRAAKAYQRSGPKGVARAVGGKWLEYQYGWKPLMQSVYDTALKVIQEPNHMLEIRGRGNATSTKSLDSTAAGVPYSSTAELSNRCEFKCKFFLPTLAQTVSEFTSLNPVSLAWELIPYSFVVDWFVDIGGYVRNVETACINGSRFNRGYVTQTFRGRASARANGEFRYPDKLSYIFLEVGSTETRVSLNRSVITSFPLPRIPRFTMDLGSGRLLNAAALLSQHLRP